MGEKLNLVKETNKLLLGEFGVNDNVGLVTFDTSVQEPMGLTPMVAANKDIARAIVDRFRPGSSTNLSGGCFAGVRQLVEQSDGCTGSKVRTVLLMTDGQANHGLQSSGEIEPVLRNMLKNTGISVHTFGYGENHDSGMLRGIAEVGSGSYYFVEGVDDIRSAFGDCLGGLLSVVAQNLVLEVEAINGATITRVHHRNAQTIQYARSSGSGVGAATRVRVPFADLYADEQRDVLVSLRLPRVTEEEAAAAGEAEYLCCSLTYVDVLAQDSRKAAGAAACPRAGRSAARARGPATRDPALEVHSMRLRVAETLEDARTQAEQGDLKGARAAVASTQAAVRECSGRLVGGAGSSAAATLLPSFDNDLNECAAGLVDRRAFDSARHKMAYLSKGHLEQRCAESSSMKSAATPQLRANAYRSPAKAKMASKFSGGGS